MKKKPTYLIFIVISIAALVLLGWQFDIEVFKNPIFKQVAMNPMSATGLLLMGLSFLLLVQKPGVKNFILAARVLAVMVTCIGAIKLAAVLSLFDARIDLLLFPRKIETDLAAKTVSRIAPNTALGLLLYGLALLLGSFNKPRPLKTANYLAGMVFTIGLFSTIGYLYNVKEYYGILTYIPMAVHTAACLILASLALLLYNNKVGYMALLSGPRPGGQIARILIPASILVPVALGYIRLYTEWRMHISVELGVALLVTGNVIAFFCLIWYVAIALNKSDDARSEDLAELRRQAELFNILPHAVLYGTRDLAISSINKAAEDLFEVKADKAVGRKLDEIIQIEVVGVSRDEVRSGLWGEKGFWQGESNFVTATGKKINALVTLKAINTGDGNKIWLGIYTDITPLKQIQQRLEFALEGMVAGLWEWDIKNPEKGWLSPRYNQLLGYEENELAPTVEGFKKLLHPRDVDSLLLYFRQKTLQKEGFEIEMRYRTKAGNYKWFAVSGKTKFDAQGQPVAMIGSIVDIDDKKRARDIIVQQAKLIKMVPDGIVFSTKSRKFIDINEGAERMFGLKREEVVGRDVDDFIALSFAPGIEFKDAYTQLWQNGFWRGEMRISNKKSGKTVSVLTNIKTFENADGEEPGFMTIYTDLSPLHINEELKRALTKLETNNLYLEQFAYISSHDIKAPIITLAGLTEVMAKMGAVKEEHNNLLGMLTNTVNQMQRTNASLNEILRLRNELLDKELFTPETFELKTVFEEVQGILQQETDVAKALIEFDFSAVAKISFPYVNFKSIVYNLMSNALKYRDPARPLVVKVTAGKTSDNFLLIIEDNGLGMDIKRTGAKLFGIFKRFHKHVEGSGIGLHIVKSVVESYGGKIDVESAPGVGTRFMIYFSNDIIVE